MHNMVDGSSASFNFMSFFFSESSQYFVCVYIYIYAGDNWFLWSQHLCSRSSSAQCRPIWKVFASLLFLVTQVLHHISVMVVKIWLSRNPYQLTTKHLFTPFEIFWAAWWSIIPSFPWTFLWPRISAPSSESIRIIRSPCYTTSCLCLVDVVWKPFSCVAGGLGRHPGWSHGSSMWGGLDCNLKFVQRV